MDSYNPIHFAVNWAGNHGPIFLILAGLLNFIDQFHKFVIFLAGVFVNVGLNMWIKPIIREKRPKDIGLPPSDPQYWGMPSGHAQYVGYVLTYLYLSKLKPVYFTFMYCLGLLILWQRWYTMSHSATQVLVGCLVGICLGVIFAYIRF